MSIGKKIQILEGEISQIDEKIEVTTQNIEQATEFIASLEGKLYEERVSAALNETDEGKKKVTEAKNRISSARDGLEDDTILLEALSRKKTKLQDDWAELKLGLQQEEAKRLSSKLPALIKQYNEAVTSAYNASVEAKIILDAVMARNGKDFLKEKGPDILRMIRGMMPNYILAKFRSEAASSPEHLNVADVDKNQVLEDLLK